MIVFVDNNSGQYPCESWKQQAKLDLLFAVVTAPPHQTTGFLAAVCVKKKKKVAGPGVGLTWWLASQCS